MQVPILDTQKSIKKAKKWGQQPCTARAFSSSGLPTLDQWCGYYSIEEPFYQSVDHPLVAIQYENSPWMIFEG